MSKPTEGQEPHWSLQTAELVNRAEQGDTDAGLELLWRVVHGLEQPPGGSAEEMQRYLDRTLSATLRSYLADRLREVLGTPRDDGTGREAVAALFEGDPIGAPHDEARAEAIRRFDGGPVRLPTTAKEFCRALRIAPVLGRRAASKGERLLEDVRIVRAFVLARVAGDGSIRTVENAYEEAVAMLGREGLAVGSDAVRKSVGRFARFVRRGELRGLLRAQLRGYTAKLPLLAPLPMFDQVPEREREELRLAKCFDDLPEEWWDAALLDYLPQERH